MKIFPIKIFAPRRFKHVTNMKRTCPLCGTLLELDERTLKCPKGCDISEYDLSEKDSDDEESADSSERKEHRKEYRKNPGKYKKMLEKGMKTVKKAFFIDRKV